MDRTLAWRQKVSAWGMVLVIWLLSAGTAAAIECYQCHGTTAPVGEVSDYRPVDAPYRNITSGGFQGSHRNHMAKPGSPAQCAKCHPGSETYSMGHRDGYIKAAANINDSPSPFKALYKNSTSSFFQTDDKTAGNALGSCSNVNCHFESPTPSWGSVNLVPPAPGAPNGCTTCHTAPAGEAAPADGSHPTATVGSGKKHGDYLGTDTYSCGHCHVDHNGENTPFSHATSVGKRPLIVRFTSFPNSGGTYHRDLSYPSYLPSQLPLRNGDCSDLYCHSNGAPFDKPNLFATAPWGGTLTCSSCHGGGGSATTLSGRHDSHVDEASYNYSCEWCHNDTVSGRDAIKDRSRHVMNREKDVAIKDGGTYNGDKSCSSLYCHSDARSNEPVASLKWGDAKSSARCFSCHKGLTSDSTSANCAVILGNWSSATQTCTPSLSMTSNGHARLVGPQWIRKYPCNYCHNATVSDSGAIKNKTRHVDKIKDVVIHPKWNIVGKPEPGYDPENRVCTNVYCHSDGTTNPETVRPFAWTENKTNCNSCHGHPLQSCATATCHDGRIDPVTGKKWDLPLIYGNQSSYDWPDGQKWKSAIPMFKNEGAGTPRANSHSRHVETDFTCDRCHFTTIKKADDSCSTPSCHGQNTKAMGEISHLEAAFHVNRSKDVVFRNNSGTYNDQTKTCTNTVCHIGTQPQWGSSVSSAVICLDCHGSTGLAAADMDDYNAFNGSQGKINIKEWEVSGHGRFSSAGAYPASGNPPAKFPGNPCWYCHDNSILHKDSANPFRLRMHQQFAKRFDRECVYCHMEGEDYECVSCHYQSDYSIATQMQSTSARQSHNDIVYSSGCIQGGCHGDDVHKTGAGKWQSYQKADVRNQYMMMGVCLQCHDDDSGGQCNSCHTPLSSNPLKYSLGFDPGMEGTRFIKPEKARASASHFGYKHGRAFDASGGWGVDGKAIGTWKGGKFCWDCHDPHGDKNIYMIQDKVSTKTDGTFGIPLAKADVVFSRKVSGSDYARSEGTIDGICNVCHSPDPAINKHYSSRGGDRHNSGRVCTSCHEHRFADSHADKQPCDSCHKDKKPVPKHTAFGLPRDCVKCHGGIIGKRMDVMTQFKANSHHVQGIAVTNKHCYQCHWESTEDGLIDITHHEGYNYKNYSTVKNAVVDLVISGPNQRPTVYKEYTTAIKFLASNMSEDNDLARRESEKVTDHCISCHSDKNNDYTPFGDCKTPRQYAWDFQSIDARYSQLGIVTWGKYPSTAGAAQKNISKALSAHGNARGNSGGFSTYSGVDGTIPNTRAGSYNVTCYDCHSSHGSAATGAITSYLTFNNTNSGGNLKETQAGKGGYTMGYKAEQNPDRTGINPYNTGAAQCFDCHITADAGIKPWGYSSTFGATSAIMGDKDTPAFGQGIKAATARFPLRAAKATIRSSHFKASSDLKRGATGTINGLCTPCHDPHGVSPTLGQQDQAYAVPLLKGTWMTSPYKEDNPPINPVGENINSANNGIARSWGRYVASNYYQNSPKPTQPWTRHNIDRNTFGGTTKIGESAEKFAGLCLVCHSQANLAGGTETGWMGLDKVHKAVSGWGGKEHSFTCSKCHQPHNSGLPRLMKTNCLDSKHRGNSVSSGEPWAADKTAPYGYAHSQGAEHRGYPIGSLYGGRTVTNPVEATTACHVSRFNKTYNSVSPPAEWPSGNLWNSVTPW